MTFARTQITSDDIASAEEILAETPVYKGSHREEAANHVGIMGEVIARRWLKAMGVKYVPTNTTQHDLIMPKPSKTIDVKTKDRTVIPRLDYEASVPLYNHEHQRPDYYLFLSLHRDKSLPSNDLRRFQEAYVLGAASQKLLHTKGIERDAGEVDPRNGTKFWTKIINLYHYDLIAPNKSAEYWRQISPYVNGWEE